MLPAASSTTTQTSFAPAVRVTDLPLTAPAETAPRDLFAALTAALVGLAVPMS
jgi:hypothetical protein